MCKEKYIKVYVLIDLREQCVEWGFGESGIGI
jgi:hypothetical protein